MSFCSNCGSAQDKSWKFCHLCGSSNGKYRNAQTSISSTPIDRSVGSLSHILGAIFGFLIPLIIYLVRDQNIDRNDPLLLFHLRESLNTSISFTIAVFIHILLMFVIIGIFTFLVHWICYIVWAINASSALKEGKKYRYPLTIRFA